jgi:hypothetical protein
LTRRFGSGFDPTNLSRLEDRLRIILREARERVARRALPAAWEDDADE